MFSPQGRGRGIKRPAERETPTATSKAAPPVSSPPTPKRRGRPPTYQPVKVLPATESSEGNTATDTSASSNTTIPVSVVLIMCYAKPLVVLCYEQRDQFIVVCLLAELMQINNLLQSQ